MFIRHAGSRRTTFGALPRGAYFRHADGFYVGRLCQKWEAPGGLPTVGFVEDGSCNYSGDRVRPGLPVEAVRGRFVEDGPPPTTYAELPFGAAFRVPGVRTVLQKLRAPEGAAYHVALDGPTLAYEGPVLTAPDRVVVPVAGAFVEEGAAP